MSNRYGSLALTLRTLRTRVLGMPDRARWADLGNYDQSWDERSRLIAGLVADGARVIEFGAGRQQLRRRLAPSCTYYPADLVAHRPDTIICDLNARPLPTLRQLNPDVAVFAGVLEYIRALPSVLSWLAATFPACIASYECARSQPMSWGRLRESVDRTRAGWVNSFSEGELLALFRQARFVCVDVVTWHTPEGDERIFSFQRQSGNQRIDSTPDCGIRSDQNALGVKGKAATAASISVVIPCYNQAQYLAEAITSVRTQTHPAAQVIVVDDGSTDRTRKVCEKFAEVDYIYQANQGLAAARNSGLRASRGELLLFLDADDRLLPDALRRGLQCIEAHPDAAFVSGHHRYIDAAGSVTNEYPPEPVDQDSFVAMLKGNYIGMHGTVLYRRKTFDSVGDFDASLRACEDYDFYLRVTRQLPVYRHDALVAEYRWHDANMSRNAGRMLSLAVKVLDSQWPHIETDAYRRAAYRSGVRFWHGYFGGRLTSQLFADLRSRRWSEIARGLRQLLRIAPRWLRSVVNEMTTRRPTTGPGRQR